jgi:Chaperone of endosialidase
MAQQAEAAQLGADSSIYNGASAIGTAETIANQNTMTGIAVQGGTALASAAAGGMAMSDARSKTELSSDERGKSVRPGGNTLADKFMEHLHPYSFKYRDVRNEPRAVPTGGEYLGVMAQDVERAPGVGRQIVRDTPRGKVLETGATMSALAAGVGRLHERLKALEGARASK